MIRLETVTPENWRFDLHVSQAQKDYVADKTTLLARAYAFRAYRSHAFMIFNNDTPIGMALYYDCDPLAAYDFSQLFIDERYQGNGYGLAAAKLILDRMKQDGKYEKVVLCYIDGNEAAKKLYEKAGFHLTGEQDEDEIIMEMALK